MPRSRFFRFLILSFLFAVSTRAADDSAGVRFLPSSRIFPLQPADALCHQLSLSRITDNREWIGTIGGSVPLVQFQSDPYILQLSLSASSFNRLIKTPGHVTITTVDYKVDVPLDVRYGAGVLRLGIGHVSSHFADDGIEILRQTSVSSVKDYVAISASYAISQIRGCVYAGLQYNYHNEPVYDKKLQVQLGCTGGTIDLGEVAELYGSADIKIKEEISWGTTQSYQVGIRFLKQDTRAVRLCYTIRTGFEERGQYYATSTTNSLITIALEL